MRKLILITAMVLASASAQAGERSLTLGGGENSPVAAPVPAATQGRIAEAPVVEPPPRPPETPRYIERPAATAAPAPQPQGQPQIQPAVQQQADVEPQAAPAERPVAQRRAGARKSGDRRYAGRWTSRRIIGELHRHGIYW